MERLLLGLAAIYGLTGVAVGAFAAHALKARLDAYALGIMQTATLYQMIHALAILACVNVLGAESGGPRNAQICFALGIPLFSGSLYALALTGHKMLGAITPIGGLFFLLGWGCLLLAAIRSQ